MHLLIALGLFRLSAWKAGLLGLIAAIIVAHAGLRHAGQLVASATLYGAAFGLFPIAWIVFWALALYRLTVDTGQFEIIKNSVGHLTQDRRLQALLIAFAFGAFIEGAAGFGTPVAVAAAMLTGLGFSPLPGRGHLSDRQHLAGRVRRHRHAARSRWRASPTCRSPP